MAEFLNQTVDTKQLLPFDQMGKPIPLSAKAEGYEHCKAMGLSSINSIACTNAVAAQLERDKPYEAMSAGMKYLDLTGVYRLFAVILCKAADEKVQSAKPIEKRKKANVKQ